jgi:predicted AAA+ superfamily ATPase
MLAWRLGYWVSGDPQSMNIHAQRGALFETLIVSEFFKQRFNCAQPADLYFWRYHVGHEVDLLYELGDQLQAIEIKSGATFLSLTGKRHC